VTPVSRELARGEAVKAKDILIQTGLNEESIERHLNLCRLYISDFSKENIPNDATTKGINIKLSTEQYKKVLFVAHEKGFKHPREYVVQLLRETIPDFEETEE